jgi:hypothetical protein
MPQLLDSDFRVRGGFDHERAHPHRLYPLLQIGLGCEASAPTLEEEETCEDDSSKTARMRLAEQEPQQAERNAGRGRGDLERVRMDHASSDSPDIDSFIQGSQKPLDRGSHKAGYSEGRSLTLLASLIRPPVFERELSPDFCNLLGMNGRIVH